MVKSSLSLSWMRLFRSLTCWLCTILLGHMTDLLGKGLDLLGITTKMAPRSCNDVLGVMLQLEHVLGIAHHVCPTTMVVVLKDIAHLIHA
jgi:hypothetical protein